MKVINFFAGPGAGKSTAAAAAFVWLKQRGFKAELISEAAKDMIYEGRAAHLENQVTVTARQFEKLDNLKRYGCEIAVCDSPLLLGKIYSKGYFAEAQLVALIDRLWKHFENTNIWVARTKEYQTFGRMQGKVEEAVALDERIKSLVPSFDLTITGDDNGHERLQDFMAKTFGGK